LHNTDTSRPTAHTARKLFSPVAQQVDDGQTIRLRIFYELKEVIPNGCFTSFFEKETTKSKLEGVNVNVPETPPLENEIIKLAEVCKTVEEFISKVPVLTELDEQSVEHSTTGQASNDKWIMQRKGRITASNFYYVFTKMNSIKKIHQKKYTTLNHWLRR